MSSLMLLSSLTFENIRERLLYLQCIRSRENHIQAWHQVVPILLSSTLETILIVRDKKRLSMGRWDLLRGIGCSILSFTFNIQSRSGSHYFIKLVRNVINIIYFRLIPPPPYKVSDIPKPLETAHPQLWASKSRFKSVFLAVVCAVKEIECDDQDQGACFINNNELKLK